MVAEFYIIPESFQNNGLAAVDEIEQKTKLLAADFVVIKKYKETNKLLIHPDIYNVVFVNNLTISELIFDPTVSVLDRDARVMLKKIVVESETTNLTVDEVKDVLVSEHTENLCYGFIGFNQASFVDIQPQIIYNIQGWYNFRRHYLSIYPKNSIFFMDECTKYFPKLYFHEQNKKSISQILYGCSTKILYHLAALNDKFDTIDSTGLNRTQVLEQFSITSKLDEIASIEGNASRKKDFTFNFENDKGQMEEVCCEPHLKLCYNDNYPGDTSYSNNRRIYFHEGVSNIQGGKILVGHIGIHL